MNFYEYHNPDEQLEKSFVYLAAKDLMQNGFQVIPLEKKGKSPANIKSVYDIISRPIHEHNFDFYFDRDVDLGIIMDHNMEFIDIDVKNKRNVAKLYLRAIELGWPELYEKLVIDYTPSGGCHVIYRSEVVGGKPSLAKVMASPNPLTIIERINRHNKQYIKISPSDGYTLYQGNPFEIPFLTAEERNFLVSVAVSFNEVHAPEVPKKEAAREDSPWLVYNKTHDWKYIRNELIDRNWQVYRDEEEKLYVLRPGDTSQKYSGVIFKTSNVLYLFTPSTEFENEKPYSPFGVYCLFYHDNNIPSAIKQLASEGCGTNILEEGQFWKKVRNKYEIKYTELLLWLHSIGYRMYNKTVVQIIHNVVQVADETALKRAFINEVEFEVQDRMYEKVATMFSEGGGLMSMLKELDDNFVNDGPEHTWLFFQNFALKITGSGFEPFEYRSLEGYIWNSDIIPREFYECDYAGCDADRFVAILGGTKKDSLQAILGYAVSRYKDPLNPRAIVLMEDIDPDQEGESQGGSGKGLLFNFVRQFRKAADFDGKNFRPQDSFLYQNVEPDTSLLFIDDVEKNFKFTALFSILTGSLQINKKNKPQVIIPFDKAPKVFITSNYSVGAMDNSSVRRKYEFAIRKYFGDGLEPKDEFGRQFFSEWDMGEWLRFDNFMATCCQVYLAANKRAIGNITENSAERSLISNTNKEFIEYMDGQMENNFFDFAPNQLKTARKQMPDGSVITNAVDLVQWNLKMNTPLPDPNYYLSMQKEALTDKIIHLTGFKKLSTTLVTQWVNRWAKAREVEIDNSYKRGNDGGRSYRIVSFSSDFMKSKSGNSHLQLGNDPQKSEEPPF